MSQCFENHYSWTLFIKYHHRAARVSIYQISTLKHRENHQKEYNLASQYTRKNDLEYTRKTIPTILKRQCEKNQTVPGIGDWTEIENFFVCDEIGMERVGFWRRFFSWFLKKVRENWSLERRELF
jgi:hypothetical protein